MDKAQERHHLSEVFGAELAGAFEPGERPDFAIEIGTRRLGAEVTSFFSTNAAAKLVHDPDYAERLKSGHGSVHRHDREFVEVLLGATITIQGKDQTVNVVRQTVPPMADVMAKFMSELTEKEDRFGAYSRGCAAVDLVIADDENVFFFESWFQLQYWSTRILPKTRILRSPFREIYLTTGSIDYLRVSVPLKGNLLFSDCYAYAGLIEHPFDRFDLFCACLYFEGYVAANPMVAAQSKHVRLGTWLFEITQNSPPRPLHGPLVLDESPSPSLQHLFPVMNSAVLMEAQRLVEARRNQWVTEQLVLTSMATRRVPSPDGRVHVVRVDANPPRRDSPASAG